MCDEYDELHLDELRKKWDAERSMWKEFAQNNLLGRELEKVGEFEKAIELYEQNVARRDEGSHPYERLAVIYSKMKKYDDVKRILEIVID
ncbi:MAG: hypothetical protein FWF19_00475, partial [Euryarchaeota archaeon]|nr:hypothetical protein [Euryarchaeota archaeon]